jgi:hypothetical protein
MLPQANACIDPDSVPTVHTNYDTTMIGTCSYADKIEIRLSNLRMMNESPNKICACALSSFASLFSNLQYVAFVDSGTNNPYNGFAGFQNDQAYDAAWNTSQSAFGGWSGFIADVINGGLQADDPVEMVIRAMAPPNTLVAIDSFCVDTLLTFRLEESNLGTDAWDPIAADLDESHQGVRGLENPTLSQVSEAYFTALDDAILNNIPTDTNSCTADFLIMSGLYSEQPITFMDASNMNGNQYVVWDFGDGSPTVEAMSNASREHTYAQPGTYTVCNSNINNGGECDAYCETITIQPLGAQEALDEAAKLKVYPNPADAVLYLDQRMMQGRVGIGASLVSLNGQVVKSFATPSATLDVSDVAPGMYHVVLEREGASAMSEMVIIKH